MGCELNFTWVDSRGAFVPNVRVPENWQAGIQEFYKHRGKEETETDAENLAKSMEDLFGKPEIRLRWDESEIENKGLTGISLGANPAMYFQKGRWVEHNLGTKYSLMAALIISNYYKKLSDYIPEQK